MNKACTAVRGLILKVGYKDKEIQDASNQSAKDLRHMPIPCHGNSCASYTPFRESPPANDPRELRCLAQAGPNCKQPRRHRTQFATASTSRLTCAHSNVVSELHPITVESQHKTYRFLQRKFLQRGEYNYIIYCDCPAVNLGPGWSSIPQLWLLLMLIAHERGGGTLQYVTSLVETAPVFLRLKPSTLY